MPESVRPDRRARVKAVFLDAIERSGTDRDAFVLQACAGDDELRAEVQSLLASDDASGSFCETPAPALLTADDAVSAARLESGTRLGLYEVIDFMPREEWARSTAPAILSSTASWRSRPSTPTTIRRRRDA